MAALESTPFIQFAFSLSNLLSYNRSTLWSSKFNCLIPFFNTSGKQRRAHSYLFRSGCHIEAQRNKVTRTQGIGTNYKKMNSFCAHLLTIKMNQTRLSISQRPVSGNSASIFLNCSLERRIHPSASRIASSLLGHLSQTISQPNIIRRTPG